MLLIPCPHCGPRDEGEFDYGGPLRTLPPLDGVSDAAAWHRALHLGNNPRGPLLELWYHASGCETWITVTRDTITHEIGGSSLPGGKGGPG
ncbi:sarcosine oxidase subunit delta [Defluviimonas sp. D31]|uniref:sarcosine oxidase subunit delta n=1 Tax=Defluviimonas sp. D31 TaxID=3083253 RepID=UPI00296FF1DD|nr:sarcosine oxidase subunit delta [Defluviimonas sp. D31]MDW4551231.1 sarcosine oxidase subunit delta [Defluviimonas sp. D31]